MIFALIGQSASGKSRVDRELESRGLKRIISHTTRPLRKNENSGVDYHFIDYCEFQTLEHNQYFAETAKYRDWYYGLSLKGIEYKYQNYVVVVTYKGYQSLLSQISSNNVTGIYLKVDERERLIRQLHRGDDVDEIIRRLYTDRIDFAHVERDCKYVVDNSDLESCLNTILEIVALETK